MSGYRFAVSAEEAAKQTADIIENAVSDYLAGKVRLDLPVRVSEIMDVIYVCKLGLAAKWVVPVESGAPPETTSSEPITDADRINALENLLTNCPHAQLRFNADEDADERVGFTVRVEGCQRTEFTAPSLREALDWQVRYLREWQAGNLCENCGQHPCECGWLGKILLRK